MLVTGQDNPSVITMNAVVAAHAVNDFLMFYLGAESSIDYPIAGATSTERTAKTDRTATLNAGNVLASRAAGWTWVMR